MEMRSKRIENDDAKDGRKIIADRMTMAIRSKRIGNECVATVKDTRSAIEGSLKKTLKA